MPAGPAPFLKAIAPYREDLGGCVECLFTWYWLAALCTRAGLPFVLGHALYLKAIHGGKAQNDRSAAPTLAVLLRGGMLPQADVSPAAMRAPRDRLRRRRHLTRKRAEWRAPSHKTTSQDNRPEIGKTLAYQAHRDGGADRFADPAVQERREGERA